MIFFHLCVWERERERERDENLCWEEREREREREYEKWNECVCWEVGVANIYRQGNEKGVGSQEVKKKLNWLMPECCA